MTAQATKPNDTTNQRLGATVERIYYSIPGHYGYGPDFNTMPEALDVASDKLRGIIDGKQGEFAPHKVEVVTRMVFAFVGGGSSDEVTSREYVTPDNGFYRRKYGVKASA